MQNKRVDETPLAEAAASMMDGLKILSEHAHEIWDNSRGNIDVEFGDLYFRLNKKALFIKINEKEYNIAHTNIAIKNWFNNAISGITDDRTVSVYVSDPLDRGKFCRYYLEEDFIQTNGDVLVNLSGILRAKASILAAVYKFYDHADSLRGMPHNRNPPMPPPMSNARRAPTDARSTSPRNQSRAQPRAPASGVRSNRSARV